MGVIQIYLFLRKGRFDHKYKGNRTQKHSQESKWYNHCKRHSTRLRPTCRIEHLKISLRTMPRSSTRLALQTLVLRPKRSRLSALSSMASTASSRHTWARLAWSLTMALTPMSSASVYSTTPRTGWTLISELAERGGPFSTRSHI